MRKHDTLLDMQKVLQKFIDSGLQNRVLDPSEYGALFHLDHYPLLPLMNAAFQVRQKFWNRTVTIHIINNAQNGHCPEDCHYCAQAKSTDTDIVSYPLKSLDEMVSEAKRAYEQGAHRYCMVLSGRGPTPTKLNQIITVIRKIKAHYPKKEICLSAGLMTEAMAIALKQAGLDRLNHNLNTTDANYKTICTTHTYQDRLTTLQAAQKAGLSLCSGLIVGLGESQTDIIELALKFRELKAASIPVNFLIPIPGTPFENEPTLTPDYCLRVLALFRFINPSAEIRMAAGREYHLRSMQVLGLYPANSLFMDGYLNTSGSNQYDTLKMIKDAGFEIESDDKTLDQLLQTERPSSIHLKTDKELHPTI